MEKESLIYDLANNASDIDKVLKELISQLDEENTNKVFYINKVIDGENSYLEINTKGIDAGEVGYSNSTVVANNVQEVIDYILANSGSDDKKIDVYEQEIPIGDGDGWVQGKGASGVYIGNSSTTEDNDNFSRNWKMIGIKKDANSISSIVLTNAMDTWGDQPKEGYSYFEIGDNSQVTVLHNVDVKIGRQNTNINGEFDHEVTTRVHIFDGAKVDIDGGESRGAAESPNVYLHGPIDINIDDGSSIKTIEIEVTYRLNYSDIGGRPSPDLTAAEIKDNSATVGTYPEGYSSEQEILDDGFALPTFSPWVYKETNYYRVTYTYWKNIINLYTGPSGHRGDRGPALIMHDKSCFSMTGGSSFYADNTAKVHLDAGLVEMQSSDTSKRERDPHVSMQDGAQIIMTGHDKGKGRCGSCLCLNGNSYIIFNAGENDESEPDFVKKDPYLLADPNGLLFVGQGSSGNSYGNPTRVDLETKGGLYPDSLNPANKNPRIKISDESLLIVDTAEGGSNYVKIGACTGGQVQTHILDNTHLELRQNSIFSLRGKSQGTPIEDYPITKNGNANDDTGSIFTMYDNSTFIMRSEWEEFTAEQYENKKNFRKRPLTQETWQPNLDFWKQEGSPLFGMVGNSILKMQNNAEVDLDGASIIADGTGFTFKSGEQSVSFTINELQQLKALLGS